MSARQVFSVVFWVGWALSGGCDSEGAAEAEQEEAAAEAEQDGEQDDEPEGELTSCRGLDVECQDGAVCESWTCGGQPAQYNHGGCPRTACGSDSDCPAEEACYARAYGASCLPSDVVCTADGDGCGCTPQDDCDGVLQAHCLPVAVYAPATYCDVDAWSCSELPDWIDALDRAASEHQRSGGTELVDGLRGCAERARAALSEC